MLPMGFKSTMWLTRGSEGRYIMHKLIVVVVVVGLEIILRSMYNMYILY